MEKICEHLYRFTYPRFFSTHCYVVETGKNIFVIDTYMGPGAIGDMTAAVERMRRGRNLYVINTHHHFDHIWGNCAFEDAVIVGHRQCRDLVMKGGADTLRELGGANPDWVEGEVSLEPPELIFEDRLHFEDGGCTVTLEHFPGHTSDSLIVWLEPMHVCIAGDSVEYPFPTVWEEGGNYGLSVYISNLERLLERRPEKIFPGHGRRTDPELAEDNIFYLKMLQKGLRLGLEYFSPYKCLPQKNIAFQDFYMDVHRSNIRSAAAFLEE